MTAACWLAIDPFVRYPSPNWSFVSYSSPQSVSSIDCRTLEMVSSSWGPSAADWLLVPIVSVAMPCSAQIRVNRFSAFSPW